MKPMSKLPQQWLNTLDTAPHGTWMLRGHEDICQVSLEQLSNYASSIIVLRIDQFGLEAPLRSIQFVESSNCLYYTRPDYPKTLFSASLNIPSLIRGKTIAQPLPNKKEFSGEIVAQSATLDQLYVLTLDRSRTATDDLWQIYRIPLNSDTGFHVSSHEDKASIMIRNPNIPRNGSPTFCVGRLTATRTSFFLSFPNLQQIYMGEFSPGQQLKIEPLPITFEGLPKRASFTLSTATSRQKKKEFKEEYPDLTLLAATDLHNRLFAVSFLGSDIVHRDRSNQIKYEIDFQISSMDFFSFNTSRLGVDIHPEDRFISMHIFASPTRNQIWSITNTKRNLTLPLLGGGSSPLGRPNPTWNLLDYDIGKPDTVCAVDNRFVLFGRKDSTPWGVLCLPNMVSFPDKKCKTKPRFNSGPFDLKS